MYGNSLTNNTDASANTRNNGNLPFAIGNNLVPGPNMVNLPMVNLENLTRMIQQEYNRLDREQKTRLKRFLIAPGTLFMAVLGVTNMYRNQKNKTDSATENITTALWSVAVIPFMAYVTQEVNRRLRNTGGNNLNDGDTASLSLQSESEMNTLEDNLEMGILNRTDTLHNLAVVPETTQRQLKRAATESSLDVQNKSQHRVPRRSRSFP